MAGRGVTVGVLVGRGVLVGGRGVGEAPERVGLGARVAVGATVIVGVGVKAKAGRASINSEPIKIKKGINDKF